MQVYHYCLCLLAFVIVIINSRYLDRPFDDDERGDDLYFPNNHYLNRAYRSHALNRYLRGMLALENQDDEKSDEAMTFERRTKSITKGDPREFMG